MVHLYLARIMHDFNNIWDLDSLGAAKITQVNLSSISILPLFVAYALFRTERSKFYRYTK